MKRRKYKPFKLDVKKLKALMDRGGFKNWREKFTCAQIWAERVGLDVVAFVVTKEDYVSALAEIGGYTENIGFLPHLHWIDVPVYATPVGENGFPLFLIRIGQKKKR